jgi:hypothetical protein
MRVSVSNNSSASRPEAVESLKMLLGCAIAEGTDLRLPVFGGRLRMANLKLAEDGKAMRARMLPGTKAQVAP